MIETLTETVIKGEPFIYFVFFCTCVHTTVVVSSCCNGTQALSCLYISSESLNAHRGYF